MSLQFNELSGTGAIAYKGIVQIYEKEAGFNLGDISGNTTRLKELTADINMAMDDFMFIALRASGDWQFDDSNQTSYPIITTNLVSGQRDYPIIADTDGNLVLDIYKVLVLPSATSTLYQPIEPIDAQSDDWNNIQMNLTATGVPYQYDKTANGIFLDPIPGYNATAGLKVYVNREASYFIFSDTTRKPGVPGLFHRYFAIKPAMEYARRKSLASYQGLAMEVAQMEKNIEKYFGKREKDVRPVVRGKKINFI